MTPVELDLLRTLEQLQDAADAVFGRIASRVGMEHERLMDLSKRIQAAKATVDSMSGSRQAITVLSSAKYPEISSAVDYRPLFGGHDEPLPALKVEINTGSFKEDENEGTLELFRFFMETSHEQSNVTLKHKDGVDPDVRSIADIVPVLPVAVQEQKPPDQALDGKSTPLYPPPQSLTQRNNTVVAGLEEYGFKPTLRQVPLFTLPSKIPDLPMVADISWTGSKTEELSSIVPSASNKSPYKLDLNNKAQLSRNPSESTPPTSPPQAKETGQIKDDDKGKNIIPPPPPPPPPSPLVIGGAMNRSEIKASTSSTSTPPPRDIPPIDPSRSALLASIRSPNIRLRKTEMSEKIPELSQEVMPPSSNSKQADLLAEMASTLKMRRLSMKGAAHDNSRNSGASSSRRTPLPITNLKPFLPQTPGDDEDDDDWED